MVSLPALKESPKESFGPVSGRLRHSFSDGAWPKRLATARRQVVNKKNSSVHRSLSTEILN